MTRLLTICVLFSLSATSQTLGKRVTLNPLILIAGESNAGGRAPFTELTATELSVRRNMQILNNYTLLFEPLQETVNGLLQHAGATDNSGHGIENQLANLADSGRFGNAPIFITKAGIGSARIFWYNDSTYIYNGANAWERMKARTDSSLILLKAKNQNIAAPLVLVWFQGINDSNAGLNATLWKDSTKIFFAKFRLRYGANVPIIMPYLPTAFSSYNTSITEMESEVSNFYTVSTSAATLIADGFHYDYSGYKLIARNIVTKILENLRLYYNSIVN